MGLAIAWAIKSGRAEARQRRRGEDQDQDAEQEGTAARPSSCERNGTTNTQRRRSARRLSRLACAWGKHMQTHTRRTYTAHAILSSAAHATRACWHNGRAASPPARCGFVSSSRAGELRTDPPWTPAVMHSVAHRRTCRAVVSQNCHPRRPYSPSALPLPYPQTKPNRHAQPSTPSLHRLTRSAAPRTSPRPLSNTFRPAPTPVRPSQLTRPSTVPTP